MLTWTKTKLIYTRQKSLDKSLKTDVNTTIRNVLRKTKPWVKAAVLDPKSAFLSKDVGGKINFAAKLELNDSHHYYYQVQTEMAVSELLLKSDFVIYTNKFILIVQIDFNKQFWEEVIAKVTKLYKKQLIPALFLQLSNKNLSQSEKSNSLESIDEYKIQFNGNECNKTLNMDQLFETTNAKSYPKHQDLPISSEDDNVTPTVNHPELREFLRRKETLKKLEDFIEKCCGDLKQFSLTKVTTKTLQTLGMLDEDLQEEIFNDLCLLFSQLRMGLNVVYPVTIPKGFTNNQKFIGAWEPVNHSLVAVYQNSTFSINWSIFVRKLTKNVKLDIFTKFCADLSAKKHTRRGW